MAESKWNMWDELAHYCLEHPVTREGHDDLKVRAYRLIMGMENEISSLDNQILRFLRKNHLAIMATMVRDNQVTEAMRKAAQHG